MQISFDTQVHLVEIVVLGVPLWYTAIRFFFVIREYPPHIHDNGLIRYPRGYEPGKIVKLRGED